MDTQEAVEAVETAVQTVDEIQTVVKNNPIVIAGVAVVSAAVTAGATYFLTKKVLIEKYDRLLEEEVLATRAFYQKRVKADTTPEELAEEYKEPEAEEELEKQGEMVREAVNILEEQKYVPYNKPGEAQTEQKVEEKIEVTASIQKNVFDQEHAVVDEGNDFNPDVEAQKKRSGLPYITDKETFFRNDEEHSQLSLTYFAGDDVLCDEADNPIRDTRRTIGDDNLKFGCGSEDKRIVYIRNDKLQADYEVVLNERTYTEEVLGIQEGTGQRVRKFRNHDE